MGDGDSYLETRSRELYGLELPPNNNVESWKACWGSPSRVRISYPPPSLTGLNEGPDRSPVGAFAMP